MINKNICVVTSSRADYGILKPLINRLHNDPLLNLFLVVTGTHLYHEFGDTLSEITEDGFPVHKKIDILVSSDSSSAISKIMGVAMFCFSEYFTDHTPDLLIVLGDRYEIHAICGAAVNQRIPIAHIHGGELTEGVLDEFYRHSITKMSSVHFTACETYRNRVIQMGEQPNRVFNIGALSAENTLNTPFLSLNTLEDDLGLRLRDKPFGLVTFHPVTIAEDGGISQLKELTNALDSFPEMNFIITKSNSDAKGHKFNQIWDEYAKNRDNCHIVASLGSVRYLSAIRHAAVIIGNSSSGVIEVPIMKKASVNIGDRQKGRFIPGSVVCCQPVAEKIIDAISEAMSLEHRASLNKIKHPFGNGDTSQKIIKIIKALPERKELLEKNFYDIKYNYVK